MKKLFNVDMDQLKRWLRAFRRLDRGRGGCISRRELVTALGLENSSERSVTRLLQFFDADGSGGIEYREFVQCLALLSGKCSPKSRAKLAFLLCDEEGTGLVPKDKVLATLDRSFAQSPSSLNAPLSSDLAPSLPASCIVDGQEMLNFQDYCSVVESKPEVLEASLEVVRTRLTAATPDYSGF